MSVVIPPPIPRTKTFLSAPAISIAEIISCTVSKVFLSSVASSRVLPRSRSPNSTAMEQAKEDHTLLSHIIQTFCLSPIIPTRSLISLERTMLHIFSINPAKLIKIRHKQQNRLQRYGRTYNAYRSVSYRPLHHVRRRAYNDRV